MDTQDKSLQFMQIAFKYLPQAKEQLEQAGVELSLEMVQPFMDLFSKVMQEAYDLGWQESRAELNQK